MKNKVSKSLFFLLCLFYSCDKMNDEVSSGDCVDNHGTVSLNCMISPKSRVAMTEDFKCLFENGDEIGVFAVSHGAETEGVLKPSGNYADNVKFRMTDGKWVCQGMPLLYPGNGELLDFYAYYPYREEADPTSLQYDAAVNSVDLMSAKCIDCSESRVNLSFSHELGVVIVDIDGQSSGVTMLDVFTSAQLDLSQPEDAQRLVIQEEPHDIEMSRIGNSRYAVFLPSQHIDIKELFTIKTGIHTANYLLSSALDLKPGYGRAFNLTNTAVDLSALPNCYIVAPGTTLEIPVVKAFEIWKQVPELQSKSVTFEGALSAELIWQDRVNLIESVSLEGEGRTAKISVAVAAGMVGNAVIALKEDGAVRWSWHLWITDYDPDTASEGNGLFEYDNNGDGITDYIFMDRNLGSTGELKTIDNLGLYYQWGRKDPFPKPMSLTVNAKNEIAPVYSLDGTELRVTLQQTEYTGTPTTDIKTNLVNSIENPLVFISSPSGVNDWYYQTGEYSSELWATSAAPQKSIYDPCPEGWMIPVYKNGTFAWAQLSAVSGNGISESGVNYGLEWTDFGYYPLSGRINFKENKVDNTAIAMLWNGHYDTSNKKAKILQIGFSGKKAAENNYGIASGMNVRCVKQDNSGL